MTPIAISHRAKAERARPNDLQLALHDFLVGCRRDFVWRTLAWEDIRRRYRRSFIGPLWITFSMAIMILSMGYLYGVLLGVELQIYFPFIAVSLILWGFISTCLNESTNVFAFERDLVRQIKVEWTILVLRLILRNLIILAHNAIIFVGVMVVFGLPPSAVTWLAVPGFLLIVLFCFFWGFLIACLGARFRDVGQIVQNGTQVVFFLTPILWMPGALRDAGRSSFVDYNPFYHLLEVARAPLLGTAPSAANWTLSLLLVAAGAILATTVFAKTRARLVFWV